MINILETIFPREANNDYQGSPIAFYGFLPIVAMQEFSACVHYFGDRTYKLPSGTTSEPGRYVKSLGDPVTGKKQLRSAR